MGAIGGVHSFNAAEPELRILRSLARSQARFGPDGEEIAAGGPVALLYQPFLTQSTESGEDRLHRADNGDVLVWNGRLDNRSELAADLTAAVEGVTDVEIVYWTLQRWGLDALAKVLGDFSLAFWQPAVRRLTLATDIWSLRPVFYHTDTNRLVWASRCRSLADSLGLPLEPEEDYVASFLFGCRTSERSPLKRIRMLPPASCLTCEHGALKVQRYWTPDGRRELRYARDEEYEEHYRELLEQAIACRLRTSGPVYSELSGGVDSSSIVCIGRRLLREGRAAAPALHTVSYVYRSSPSSDESRYVQIVEKAIGSESFRIDNDDAPLLAPPPATGFEPDLPSGQLVYHARNQALADRMTALGSRVLLRGFGGDQVTWGDAGLAPFEIGDHLVSGRWGRALRACRQWSMLQKIPFYQVFWRGGIWPLLPRGIRKRTVAFAWPVEAWFAREFVDRYDLRDRVLGPAEDFGFRLPSQRNQYGFIREVAHLVGWEFILDRGHVECWFPFFDRRLVDFALATPIEQMLRPGETRRLARRALRGELPPEIQARLGKAGPDEAVYRTFARHAAQFLPILEDPRVAQYGFVDGTALRAAYEKVRYGAKVVAPQLLRTFALEYWLRSLDRRRDANEIAASSSSMEDEGIARRTVA